MRWHSQGFSCPHSSTQPPNVEVHQDWLLGSLLFFIFIISIPLGFKYHIDAENPQIYFQLGLLSCCHYLSYIFLKRYNRILKFNMPKMKSLIFPFYQTYFYYSPIYHRKMLYYLAIAQARGLDNILDYFFYFTHASVSSTVNSSKKKGNRQIVISLPSS